MAIGYFLACLLVGYFAHRVGRTGFLWFFGSLVVSPAIAGIVLLLLEIF